MIVVAWCGCGCSSDIMSCQEPCDRIGRGPLKIRTLQGQIVRALSPAIELYLHDLAASDSTSSSTVQCSSTTAPAATACNSKTYSRDQEAFCHSIAINGAQGGLCVGDRCGHCIADRAQAAAQSQRVRGQAARAHQRSDTVSKTFTLCARSVGSMPTMQLLVSMVSSRPWLTIILLRAMKPL